MLRLVGLVKRRSLIATLYPLEIKTGKGLNCCGSRSEVQLTRSNAVDTVVHTYPVQYEYAMMSEGTCSLDLLV